MTVRRNGIKTEATGGLFVFTTGGRSGWCKTWATAGRCGTVRRLAGRRGVLDIPNLPVRQPSLQIDNW